MTTQWLPEGRTSPMLVTLFIARSSASMLTAVFALRFPDWHGRGFLAGYFLLFLSVEFIAGYYFLPPGALGIEVAVVCFFITAVVIAVIRYMRELEQKHDNPDGQGGS